MRFAFFFPNMKSCRLKAQGSVFRIQKFIHIAFTCVDRIGKMLKYNIYSVKKIAINKK